jgi:hypothetical protein
VSARPETSDHRAGQTRGGWAVALPPLIWGVHFLAVYGLGSAACAPRGLMALDAARLSMAGAGLVGLVLIGASYGVLRPRGGAAPNLSRAAFWSALISALAVAVQTAPAAFFASC